MIEKYLFVGFIKGDLEDDELMMPCPTGIIASLHKLNQHRWQQIKKLRVRKMISLSALPGDICPASSLAKDHIKSKIAAAMHYRPDMLFF